MEWVESVWLGYMEKFLCKIKEREGKLGPDFESSLSFDICQKTVKNEFYKGKQIYQLLQIKDGNNTEPFCNQ